MRVGAELGETDERHSWNLDLGVKPLQVDGGMAKEIERRGIYARTMYNYCTIHSYRTRA